MLNAERLAEIESYELHQGNGADLKTACVMQMVAYVAGEKWTDHPECACPILTRYAITLNDKLNTEHRQKLKPIIPLLIKTRSDDALRIKRKQFFMFRNVTVTYPLLLDLIKMPELAEKLRAFGNNKTDMRAAANFLSENKEAIMKNAYAYANANADANAYADAYAYAYADADAYADAYAYAYADAYANAYADAYAYSYANAYSYADANAYANAYAYADAYAYSCANAYANADAYSYANANAYANADSYANAYANADANRTKVADACVETLRLACGIEE
jgi:hypothetical protein